MKSPVTVVKPTAMKMLFRLSTAAIFFVIWAVLSFLSVLLRSAHEDEGGYDDVDYDTESDGWVFRKNPVNKAYPD